MRRIFLLKRQIAEDTTEQRSAASLSYSRLLPPFFPDHRPIPILRVVRISVKSFRSPWDCSKGVPTWNQWRKAHPEIMPDLSKADLRGVQLNRVDFQRAYLDKADLSGSRLSRASLKAARLYRTNLNSAQLRYVNLQRAYFHETLLERTNMHLAVLLETAFLNVDLRLTTNLETLIHLGPSTIGIDTIQQSAGRIPETFLLQAGLSEQILTSLRALGRAPFDYKTCFISYSSQDQRFIASLCQQLRQAGVSYWYAPEQLKAGEKFQAEITYAVQSREKVLVVLSKASIESKWVAIEVELARQREGNGKPDVLLPIYLDHTVLRCSYGWVASLRKHQHMSDFQQWHQPSCYQKCLKTLLESLKR